MLATDHYLKYSNTLSSGEAKMYCWDPFLDNFNQLFRMFDKRELWSMPILVACAMR